MADFVNLTPHAITLRGADGSEVTVAPSGAVARVTTTEKVVGEIAGLPLVRREFGDVEGLPAPKADTVYIVSALVLGAISGRNDVVAPDTGATAIRNDKGHIVAVTRLVAAG